MNILKGVSSRFPSQVPNIFQAYFSVGETSVLSFDGVSFSTGSFLDHKNKMLQWSKNLPILKGGNA